MKRSFNLNHAGEINNNNFKTGLANSSSLQHTKSEGEESIKSGNK